MTVVLPTGAEFTKTLENVVAVQSNSFALEFSTTSRPPDLYHTWPNSTVEKLIVNGIRTAVDNDCKFTIKQIDGGGFNVKMSCETALPKHAGTYTGTDNDEAETAQKTTADVIIVTGALISHLAISDKLCRPQMLFRGHTVLCNAVYQCCVCNLFIEFLIKLEHFYHFSTFFTQPKIQ